MSVVCCMLSGVSNLGFNFFPPGYDVDVDKAGFNFFLPGSDWPDTVRPAWVANRFFIFLYRNANKITL